MASAPTGYVAVSGVEHEPDAKPQMAAPTTTEATVVGVVAVPHPHHYGMVHRGWKFLAIAQFLIYGFSTCGGPPRGGPSHGPHHGPGPHHHGPNGEWVPEEGGMGMMPRRGGMFGAPFDQFGDVAPFDDASAACSAAASEMKKVCGDSYAAIADALEAGRITEAQAEEKYAWVRTQCKAEGKKVADTCSGPWAEPAGVFTSAAAAPVEFGASAAAPAAAAAAACKAAAAEMHKVCRDANAAIAADLKAGTITPAQAKTAFAAAVEKCQAEGKKVADACAGPWAPAGPDVFFFARMMGLPFPVPAAAAPKDPACTVAAAEVKSVCHGRWAVIAAQLAAGTLTPAQTEQQFADAAEKCADAGAAMAEECMKPKPPVVSAAPCPAKAACKAASAEMKKVCKDPYKAIAAALAAGTITKAEAKEKYAAAAEACKEEGKKVAKACAGPWAPATEGALTAPAPKDPKCAAAAAEVKTVCSDPFKAIAAQLAAGTITPAQAEAEFTDAAEKCAVAGSKMAEQCMKPKPPPVAVAGPAKCASEVAKFKTVCQDGYEKIDEELKAGTVTPAQASKDFAKVAAKCEAEGGKVAAACTPK